MMFIVKNKDLAILNKQLDSGDHYMKIIFVRHGHPNYKDDCLTELGHLQAEAVAERLKDEKIDKIFSSSCGRAVETAQHIAARHNLEVHQLDFMREIHWSGPDADDFVHPWSLADEWVKNGKDIMDPDWQNDPDFKGHRVVESYNTLANCFDEWLKELGFCREGNYYRATRENNDTVMMVSHGGASSVALSHIFNISFPFVCKSIGINLTSITEVSFSSQEGELTSPRFELTNDARHIREIITQN